MQSSVNNIEGYVGDSSESIYAYELADANKWYGMSDMLKQLFVGNTLGRPGDKTTFSVAPLCGWLQFTNEGKLWKTTNVQNFPDLKAITQVVDRYLQQRTTAFQQIDSTEPVAMALRQGYFPAQKQRISVAPVFHPYSPNIDHILYRFGYDLPSGLLNAAQANTAIPVIGGLFEFRISYQSEIIGFCFRHRPVVRKIAAQQLSIPPDSDSADSSSDQSSGAPLLAYWLEGEGVYQNFLCPFYFNFSDDEATVDPASAVSLTAEIVQATFGDMEVKAVVKGGYGDYSYEWYRWSPQEVFDLVASKKYNIKVSASEASVSRAEQAEGIKGASVANLPEGVHNVIVSVTDRKSGNYTQTQSNVYCYSSTG